MSDPHTLTCCFSYKGPKWFAGTHTHTCSYFSLSSFRFPCNSDWAHGYRHAHGYGAGIAPRPSTPQRRPTFSPRSQLHRRPRPDSHPGASNSKNSSDLRKWFCARSQCYSVSRLRQGHRAPAGVWHTFNPSAIRSQQQEPQLQDHDLQANDGGV